LITILWEELLDNHIEKLDAFLLNGLVNYVVEHGFEDLLEEFLDVDETVGYLWAILVCDTALGYITD
jgi:hypothetical protein